MMCRKEIILILLHEIFFQFSSHEMGCFSWWKFLGYIRTYKTEFKLYVLPAYETFDNQEGLIYCKEAVHMYRYYILRSKSIFVPTFVIIS